MSIFKTIEARLITEWRDAWRYWSVQLNAAGLVVLSACETASTMWSSMPPDLRQIMPYAPALSTALFAAGLVSRFVTQPKAAAAIQQKQDTSNG